VRPLELRGVSVAGHSCAVLKLLHPRPLPCEAHAQGFEAATVVVKELARSRVHGACMCGDKSDNQAQALIGS